jgi:hypothetical protein
VPPVPRVDMGRRRPYFRMEFIQPNQAGIAVQGEDATGRIIPFSGKAPSEPRLPSAPDPRTAQLIRVLRVLWRRSQLSGRDDFDRACLLIAGSETTTVERYAAAFFQGVQIFARRNLRFFNTKSEAVSEDEMWLARILLALHGEDYTSARYLMALRVAPEGHRRLGFLAQGLARGLCGEPAIGGSGDRGLSIELKTE